MNEVITQIIFILLGWLLGILSPAIVKKISEKGEKDNFKNIIFKDLNDLKKRLAPLPFRVLPKYGKLDQDNFDWIKNNSDIDFSEGIKELSKIDIKPEQILEYLNKKGLQENKLSYFKKMHLFATDSHLINLGLLDSHLVEKVLEIRFHIEAFNEDVDNFREHLKMTFLPGITDTNHEIISQELENISLDISKKSIYIVDKINIILEN